MKIENFEGLRGWRITDSLFLLENLRFDPGEEANPSTSPLTMSSGLNDSGQVFAKKLASLADIYVNDAFASSHRAHASIVGTAKLLPHFAGLQLAREIETLSYLLENPKATGEDLLQFIQGPDFPTGGVIFDENAIKACYASGRGGITTRAKAEIVEKKNMIEETDEICEKCSKPMIIRHGRFGRFLACSGFPECKNTKSFWNAERHRKRIKKFSEISNCQIGRRSRVAGYYRFGNNLNT